MEERGPERRAVVGSRLRQASPRQQSLACRHLHCYGPLIMRWRQAYNSSASLIQQSWDAATATVSLDVVGGCIYETLFEIAPNLRHLFSKPKEIMGMKLVRLHPTPPHPTPSSLSRCARRDVCAVLGA